jgi:ectoine hydroxylase-related dioxygenase (phytanoyl-CoA dioxygenase family)
VAERRALDEDGYLVLPGLLPPDLLARLRQSVGRLFEQEGEAAGSEFKREPGCRRLANLVDKGDAFRALIAHPRALGCVRHVLGPEVKLSSLNARSADPGGGAQPLPANMAAVADERGYWVCNALWLLDDYTPENGALRVVPSSHRWGRLPQEALAVPLVGHPGQALVTGRAGGLVVLNAHAWHGGTANRAGRPRASVHAFYCRRDRPQQQYQRGLLRPGVQRSLSPGLRDLLALDDPLNDRLSAGAEPRSGFLK